MDLFADWPEPVTAHLRRAYGAPVTVERLGGMSVARVFSRWQVSQSACRLSGWLMSPLTPRPVM